MKQRKDLLTRAFLISLLSHVFLFFLLVFFFQTPPLSRKNEIINIAIQPTELPKPLDVGSFAAKPGRARPSVPKTQLFTHGDAIVDRFNKMNASLGSDDNRWSEKGYTLQDDPSVEWGVGGGTFGRVQDYSLMKRIHKKIDDLLFFPGILARNNVSGGIKARLVLNELGNCDWHLTKLEGDAHLRLYVLHVLKQACDQNYKAYLGQRKQTNVDMAFNFIISEKHEFDYEKGEGQDVVGNVLIFQRNSQHSVAEWQLGPFTGMFPIPFVAVDLAWLQENFDQYLNHKKPIREFSGDNLNE